MASGLPDQNWTGDTHPISSNNVLQKKSNDFFALYLPDSPYSEESWHLPISILDIKISGEKARFPLRNSAGKLYFGITAKAQLRLTKFLKAYSGLPRSIIDQFVKLGRKQIERIEGCIHSVVDALYNSVPNIFTKHRLMHRLIRKIFSVAVSSSYERVIAEWKEFSNVCWITFSKASTMSEPSICSTNIFRCLLEKTHVVSNLINGSINKTSIERVSYLVQTRQFPPGDKVIEKKAINTFISNVGSEFRVKPRDLDDLHSAAFSIGRYLRTEKWADGLPTDVTHISLANAGDYDNPVSAGGRGAIIMREVTEWYTVVPDHDCEWKLPLGITCFDFKDIPRWRTWMRNAEPFAPKDAQFGSPSAGTGLAFYAVNDRRWGYDYNLGFQIFALALVRAKEAGFFDEENRLIPCPEEKLPGRIATVPEQGGKCRVVTTTKWWLVILEQPAGHFLREVLSRHPAAKEGLIGADHVNSWIRRLNACESDDSYALLSSDLKEATDVIPWEVASEMLRAFLTGLGLESETVNLAIVLLVSEREMEVCGKHNVVLRRFPKVRGVMMGEPLAKAVLTLLNLCCEEEAFRHYTTVIDRDIKNDPFEGLMPKKIKRSSWRCLMVIGDDHGAHGPKEYLERITTNHLRWGSKISETKHHTGRLVKVGDNPIWLDGIVTTEDLECMMPEVYQISRHCVTVKLKLFSPQTKSMEMSERANPMIGKAKDLGEALRQPETLWLTRQRKLELRARFLQRARHLLPQQRSVIRFLHLPEELGGLGLYLDSDDLQSQIEASDNSLRAYVSRIIDKSVDVSDRRAAASITRVSSIRGFAFRTMFRDAVDNYGLSAAIEAMDLPLPEVSAFGALRRLVDPNLDISGSLSIKQTFNRLRKLGWLTEEQIVEQVLRGTAFNEIMANACDPVKFEPLKWDRRWSRFCDHFGQLADRYAQTGSIITLEGNEASVLLEAAHINLTIMYNVNVTSRTGCLVNGQLVQLDLGLMETLEKSLPTLALPGILDIATCSLPNWEELEPDVINWMSDYYKIWLEDYKLMQVNNMRFLPSRRVTEEG